MTAKAVSRKHDKYTRADWEEVRIDVMRWCLKIKLSQNWEFFSGVLRRTEGKPIVEYTRTDKVWGATDVENGKLEGINALGRLLMELRANYVYTDNYFQCVRPLAISDFLLYDNPIDWVCDETNNIYELGFEKEEEHYHLTA